MTVGEFGISKETGISQDWKRPFSKIIKINLNDKIYKIFSYGHRNPFALLWEEKKISL